MTEMQITRFTDYALPATENDDRLHFCAFLRHPDRSTGLCLSLGRVEVELESGDVITASSHRRMLPSQDLRGHSNVILDTYLGYEDIRDRERRSASGQRPCALNHHMIKTSRSWCTYGVHNTCSGPNHSWVPGAVRQPSYQCQPAWWFSAQAIPQRR